MTQETITIKDYLNQKNITFKESGNEIVTHCFFSGCDDDSKENEAHLYFDSETGQYDCKKCGARGNIFTLAEHFGDQKKDLFLNQRLKKQSNQQKKESRQALLIR